MGMSKGWEVARVEAEPAIVVESVSVVVARGASDPGRVATRINAMRERGYELRTMTTAYVEQNLAPNSLVHTLVFERSYPARLDI